MNAPSAGNFGSALDSAGRQLDQVRLVGISAFGRHGVLEHERRDGQTFRADVVAHLDTRRAAATDDLAHTLDYGVLAEQVAGVLSGEPVDLVETLAERIAATVLAHSRVVAVDVTVHKPQAPLTVPFDDVVVSIRRDRTKLPAAEPWTPPSVIEPTTRVPQSPTSTAVLPAVVDPRTDDPTFDAAPVPPPAAVPGALPVPVQVSTPQAVLSSLFAPVHAGPPAGSAEHVGVPDHESLYERDGLDDPPSDWVEVVIALGSNLGAPQDTLRRAVADLAAVDGLELLAVSPLARTAPVGGVDQPDFLNAVVSGRTSLSPRALLHATQAIEEAHGRQRAERWGPRTLDVDLIVYGSTLAVTDDLELPHPRAHERAFVLQPWAQIAPDAVLPGLGGGPVAALAATAPDRDGIRWLALDWLNPPVDHSDHSGHGDHQDHGGHPDEGAHPEHTDARDRPSAPPSSGAPPTWTP